MRKGLSFALLLLAYGLVVPALLAQKAPSGPTSARRFAPVAQGERIENLDTLKEKVKQYHECACKCGCYANDLDLQANRAIAFLKRRMAQAQKPAKSAIVLDIDETTLSNYAEMLKTGFAYDSKTFAAWEGEAAAPAIPGTLRLVNEAQKLGVHVVFLTGRPERERAATERDLRAAGFDQWERLILRSADEAGMTALQYKSRERGKLVARGYSLLVNVGDQWSDLHGAPEAEYSVKYPDPYYFIK